jgi:Ca2+-binding EF-hand superfamily protein
LLAATLILVPTLRAVDTPPAAAANYGPRHAEMLKRFDANGDGKLDETEKASAKAAQGGKTERREKARQRALEKFDRDGDGKLNEAERAEAAKAWETNPRAVKRFDKNGDGKLDETEKTAAREEMKARRAGAGPAPSQ